MANNAALGVVIGGAVAASFGKALSDSSSKISSFKQKAEKVRGFHGLIGDTIRLRKEMAKTADKSGDAFAKLLKSHDANVAKLKSHGLAVDRLDRDYARLGRTLKGLDLGAAGRARIGEGVDQAKAGVRTGAAVAATMVAPVMVSANYQAIIRDIAIKGGIARTDREADMAESIRADAADTGIGRNELAEAVNALVAGGMSIEGAVAQARTIARFAVGQNADSTDTAKLVLALRQAGVTDPKAMENALGKVAVAGDLGSFEAKDMAKHFASLMPQLTAFGMAGEHATVALANMLQTQMKAAGDADEAANNLANLLGKLTADETKKKLADSGVDLEGSMQANIARGYDPITAFLGIIQQAAARTDPGKAREMAALQEQIAKAQDPAAAQKMLDGYLAMSGLSEFIVDRQAKQAALAALQNQQLHRDNLKLIQDGDGQAKIERDLADRRAASQQRWKELGQAMDEALARIGDAIRPATDAVAGGLSWLATSISDVAKAAPSLAGGILGIGAAIAALKIGVAAWKIGSGVFDIARGGWMARGAGKILDGAGKGAGKGGIAGKVADVLGAAAGGDATPVFVTNWPGGGFDVADGKPRRPPAARRAARGTLARAGAAAAGLLAPAKAAIAAPTLGAVAAGGAGTMLAAGGMVTAAGAVGYGIGTVINAGINKAMSAAAGRETSLGSWLYDKLHPQPPAAATAPDKIKPPAPAAALDKIKQPPAPPLQQTVTFAPSIVVSVQGDVKDPQRLANEMMPHLRRMFDQFQAQTRRAAMFDPAHAQ